MIRNIALLLLLFGGLSTCSQPVAYRAPQQADSAEVPISTLMECPTYDTSEHIVQYAGFTVSYNHTTLVPNWVAYELTAEELKPVYTSKSSYFSRDPNLNGRQASREDYSRSGWDKGHMAPKADMRWSEQAYWESHYFTNVCPQDHELNGGDWNALENAIRNWARQYGRVWVVCGPLFTSHQYGTIGEAKVQIPDAFFKAVLLPDGQGYRAVAYLMENRPGKQRMASCTIPLEDLEALLSRKLFPLALSN